MGGSDLMQKENSMYTGMCKKTSSESGCVVEFLLEQIGNSGILEVALQCVD